jgi:hypothetical protein
MGCGVDPLSIIGQPPTGTTIIDAEVFREYDLFLARCARSRHAAKCKENSKKITSIKVVNSVVSTTGKSSEDLIGVCVVFPLSRYIQLRRDVVDEGGFKFKSLLWHESWHCLAQAKDEPVHAQGRHLMSAMAFHIEDQEDWDRLEEELFR